MHMLRQACRSPRMAPGSQFTCVHTQRQACGGLRTALGVSSHLAEAGSLVVSVATCILQARWPSSFQACFCLPSAYESTALQIGSPLIAFPHGSWTANLGIRLVWLLFSTCLATSQAQVTLSLRANPTASAF